MLYRSWSDLATVAKGRAMFIGLNPSTADEHQDDPTIRRCIGFAKTWGYDSLVMLNLFAWRATDPIDMLQAPDPVGPENDWHLMNAAADADVIIAAWGTHGAHLGRDHVVRHMRWVGHRLHVLRLTKDGHPAHPLYLPAKLQPVRWPTTGA